MAHNWIHKLNESKSKLHKLDVIAQALEATNLGAQDAKIFLQCAWYANNSFQVFNVKKIPTTSGITCAANNINEFYQLLTDLQARTVTGNAALSRIEQVSLGFDSDLWNDLLRPTILKDLRVGATISSFNKVLKGTRHEIPVFECQLAVDSEKHPNKLTGKKILESKLDGIRVLAIVDNTYKAKARVTLYTRNGKVLTNFPHIEDQIINCMNVYQADSPWTTNNIKRFVFDGEIVSENFQALMKQARRKSNINTEDSVYTIFDVIPIDDFNRGKWNVPQRVRSNEWLGAIRDRVNAMCDSLHILEGIEVDLDTAEGRDIMERFGKDQVDMGYEGIMIKDVDAPYLCKRRTNWMKWKPTITVDLEVIDMEEGTGRNKGRLGALVCEGVDDGKLIKVNVGTGLSDPQRKDFWARKDELIGFIAEIKADVVTQNQDQDDTYSLRFPRFKGFRGFEKGEKI
jgi:DNA ligase-1